MDDVREFIRDVEKTVEKICIAGLWVASGVVIISVLLIMAETSNRLFYFVNISFAEELTGYALLFISLLAGAEAIRRGNFIRLYALTRRLPLRLQHLILAISFGIGFLVLSVYLRECITLVQESLSYHAISHTVLKTPLWIPQIVIIVGLGMMLLQVTVGVIRNVYFIFAPPRSEEKGD
jgi:C4-dicarboxylate transporter DctQ subunit